MARKGFIERLAYGTDMAAESVPGVPLVELAGDKRVLVENHMGVTEYGLTRICVMMKYGVLCINGCGMELAKMTRDQLVITGRIDSVAIQRRK